MAEIVEVSPQDVLLRRVLHRADYLEWHADFGRWVPSLAGVRFDPDGMSAFLHHLLEMQQHDASDVRSLGGTSDKPAIVYEFTAQAAEDVGFTAEHSPNNDTPIGYGHASVTKPAALLRQDERKARTDLATRMNLVFGEVDLPKPEGA
ncbi:MAG: hypothetical protein WEB06_19370 [Actinomycetota bacterium]